MKDTRHRRMILLLITILIIGSVAYAGFYSKKLRHRPAQDPIQKNQGPSVYQKPEEVIVPPIVHSKIKSLEIAGVRLKNQGTPDAWVEIDVLNKSEQTLVALSLSSGPEKEGPAISIDALMDANRPREGVKPYSVVTLRWNLSGIAEGYPIEISAAIFADGTEEGSPFMLQSIHSGREQFTRDRAAERAAKEKRP